MSSGPAGNGGLQDEQPGVAEEHRSMGAFVALCAGLLVSMVGSGLSQFALGIWVYQRTGSVTQFATLIMMATVPAILFTPTAGAIVDRFDRRRVMILSDLGAALCVLAMLILLGTGRLELWHLYPLLALHSLSTSFQVPTHMAVVSVLVPSKHIGRAVGIYRLVQGSSQLLAPPLAGWLIVHTGIVNVLTLDLASFCAAMVVLFLLRIPPVRSPEEPSRAQGSLTRETLDGLRFISRERGLLGLLTLSATTNFTLIIAEVLVTPLVLRVSSPQVLGSILAASGLGMVAGSVVMSIWGGPRRRVLGSLASVALFGASMACAGLRPSVTLMATAAFMMMFWIPLIGGCNQLLWSERVPPDMHGRAFAAQHTLSHALIPIAYLVAGPLADHVFEPLMREGGPLAGSLGQVIGVGPGRGVALMIMVTGMLPVAVATAGFFNRSLRQLEPRRATP